jgi:hypothetical protein
MSAIGHIRRYGVGAALLLAVLPLQAARPGTSPRAAYPRSPQVLFKDLFVAVQGAALYPDISRHSCGGGERLGLQFALVCRCPHARYDRHD